MRLLDDGALEWSSVVANCAMNRERGLTGSNGYGRELGFDVSGFLRERLERAATVRWLDLCCGSGRALLEAAGPRIEIVGVDLVDRFAGPCPPGVRLVTGSVADWTPDGEFDLITCVHGLHYVGDKLGVLGRAVSWLNGTGLLAANFDVASIRLGDGRPAGRALTARLRGEGFVYEAGRRRIFYRGKGSVGLPYRYTGADDQAGPNYTGQPAVNSYYEPI